MHILLGPLSGEKRFVYLVGKRVCEIFGGQGGIRRGFLPVLSLSIVIIF
jgi:hypothetical protein